MIKHCNNHPQKSLIINSFYILRIAFYFTYVLKQNCCHIWQCPALNINHSKLYRQVIKWAFLPSISILNKHTYTYFYKIREIKGTVTITLIHAMPSFPTVSPSHLFSLIQYPFTRLQDDSNSERFSTWTWKEIVL